MTLPGYDEWLSREPEYIPLPGDDLVGPCPNEPPCGHPGESHDPQAGPPGDLPWCLDCDCGSEEGGNGG